MLILQRKKGESLVLGSDIEIVITEIKGDAVKIGIKAPKEISVFRKEVFDQITTENQKASNINLDHIKDALGAFEEKIKKSKKNTKD